eukprot:PhM_4_TR374/c0_g1_i1/m.67970
MSDHKVVIIGALAATAVAGLGAWFLLGGKQELTARDVYLQSLKEMLSPDNGVRVTLAEAKEKEYLIIHGRVYDVHDYMMLHPGGADLLQDQFGNPDASDEFDVPMHSVAALEEMATMFVGMLAEE